MDAALSSPVRRTGLDAGTIWDKTPAEMTSVEHFLSDYSVVDPALSEQVPSEPVSVAPAPRSRPWGIA